MFYIERYKGRVLLTCFLAVSLSTISPASPLSSDINQSEETGTFYIRGRFTLGTPSYQQHRVGDEKEDHTETAGIWKARKIQGSFRYRINDSGSSYPVDVSMIIYWDKNVTTRLWGKPGKQDKPYDWTSTDTNSTEESKSYLLKHGYEDKIGTAMAGRSVKIIILRNPFDM